MRRAVTEVVVRIPDDLYRAVERARRRDGKTRSAIVQDALRAWLDDDVRGVLIRQYEAGYRRKPEGRREIEAATSTASGLALTPWR